MENKNTIELKPILWASASLIGYLFLYLLFSDILIEKILSKSASSVPASFVFWGILDVLICCFLGAYTTITMCITLKRYKQLFLFGVLYWLISIVLFVVNLMVGFQIIF